jgi:hypothetical protein
MKNLLSITFLILIFLVLSSAQTNNKVEIEYDRFKDWTTVSIRLPILSDLSLKFSDIFDGKKRTSTPKNVSLYFISSDIEEDYFASSSCIFLVDDQRIDLGYGKYLASRDVELLSFSISLENLKKIANAKKVEYQIGRTTLTLTDSQLEAIKEFYKQLVP